MGTGEFNAGGNRDKLRDKLRPDGPLGSFADNLAFSVPFLLFFFKMKTS